jgi:ribose-phosphate pyrophosphokinase
MTVFYTPSTTHFASNLPFIKGSYALKKFSDGEIYVKIDLPVEKEVWVVASTQPPADTLLELFFLLSALERERVSVSLLITYFAYARQSHPEEGEAASAQVIANFIKTFSLKTLAVINVHNYNLKNLLNVNNYLPFEVICALAEPFSHIIAPDKGSYDLAYHASKKCDKQFIVLEKKRPAHETVEITPLGTTHVRGALLVDDIVATANTIVNAAYTLKESGIETIHAYATHGIFSGNALAKIDESPIERFFVTDTLPPTQKLTQCPKIEIISIAPLIEKIIKGEAHVTHY